MLIEVENSLIRHQRLGLQVTHSTPVVFDVEVGQPEKV